MPTNRYLTEQEVRERLESTDNSEIVGDMYSFGQKLADQALERVRSVEHKATLFAAYGTGIVTLLASTFPKWAEPGNRHTLWIALCSSLCAFLCTWFSIRALRLIQGAFISEDEWLNTDCFKDALTLRKYRVLTLWESIDSRFRGQERKAKNLQYAEVFLVFSGLFLLFLLVQLVLQFFWHSIERLHWTEWWQYFLSWDRGDFMTLLILGGVWLFLGIILRRIRRC